VKSAKICEAIKWTRTSGSRKNQKRTLVGGKWKCKMNKGQSENVRKFSQNDSFSNCRRQMVGITPNEGEKNI